MSDRDIHWYVKVTVPGESRFVTEQREPEKKKNSEKSKRVSSKNTCTLDKRMVAKKPTRRLWVTICHHGCPADAFALPDFPGIKLAFS